MKKVFFFFSLYLCAVAVYGQAQSGSVAVQRIQQEAAILELPYSADMVNAALNDHLSRKGKSKVGDIRGFTTFRNTQPLAADSVNADLYLKVERKGRKENEKTVVSLLLRKPGESSAADNISHLNMDEAKAYLNELLPAFMAYDLEMMIKEQNKSLIDAESKLKSMVSDNEQLRKRITALEKDLEMNVQGQQQQLEVINNQKHKLAELVSQRKS